MSTHPTTTNLSAPAEELRPPADDVKAPARDRYTSIAPQDEFRTELQPPVYVGVWLFTFALHGVCAAFYITFEWLYWFLPAKATGINWTIQAKKLSVDQKYYPLLTAIHVLFAIGHILSALAMIVVSAWDRRLVLNPRIARRLVRSVGKVIVGSRSLRCVPTKYNNRGSFVSAMATVWEKGFGDNGLLGIRSPHFDFVFFCREVLQTGMQPYQVYRVTWTLPDDVLVRFYVALLILSCCSTPIFHFWFREKRMSTLCRLLCIAFDMFIDFVAVVIIPLVRTRPYWQMCDPNIADMPYWVYYDNLYGILLLADYKIVLVQGWLDLISKVIFGLNLLMCIDLCKATLKQSAVDSNATESGVKNEIISASAMAMPVPRKSTTRSTHSIVVWCGHLMFIAWTIIILGAQIHAATRPTVESCIMQTRPWFIAKPTCAVLDLDCSRTITMDGSKDAITRTINGVVQSGVMLTVFENCPQLYMSPAIQSLHNLRKLRVQNSTIVEWNEDAGLNNNDHPLFTSLYLVKTNMTTFPLGAATKNSPKLWKFFEMCASPLPPLPDDMDQRMAPGILFSVGLSNMTVVPPVIFKSKATRFGFQYTQLTAVPMEWLTRPDLQTLQLTGNPINALPPSIDGFKPHAVLSLDYTNISSLPSWVDAAFMSTHVLRLGGTPFCKELLVSNPSSPYVQLCHKVQTCDEYFKLK
ncbi:TPA: hypothetical protein N0F65_004594 [Lagenidium giganteum]|uniref:Leucine-rich repeat domain, L domain-like n=1 Tax=Lagenidium giganteum TaxID=4803 RepID=A0AAV2ZF94_9STRA|nr:TPA: hypothetical protein N0F65_004594 [Lagenidium giganteum]